MKFKDQIKDLKVTTITVPRIFLSWVNTEEGRDSVDCYERIDDGVLVYYVNTYGKESYVHKTDEFFNVLESMYNECSI